LPSFVRGRYTGAPTVVKLVEDFAPGWLFTHLELKGWLGESAAQIALRMGHEKVASLIHKGIPVVEQQVRAVFREHDPSKISTVPSLLAEFEGREWELLQELREKYGEVVDELPIVPGSDRALISPDSRMREAAGRGDYPSVVAFLVRQQPRVDVASPLVSFPFTLACVLFVFSELVVVLAGGALLQKLAHTFTGGVDALDDTYGQTALMAAAGGGHAEVVALLLDSGADADKVSYAGAKTPIVCALI
jgi:ankyrin repeat protein